MPTAEPIPDNIRRIAVLVSSVESATARQLLLHLPTPIAKQVRGALQNLGAVSAGERQRILAEFQSTAAKQSTGADANAATTSPVAKISSPQPLSRSPVSQTVRVVTVQVKAAHLTALRVLRGYPPRSLNQRRLHSMLNTGLTQHIHNTHTHNTRMHPGPRAAWMILPQQMHRSRRGRGWTSERSVIFYAVSDRPSSRW